MGDIKTTTVEILEAIIATEITITEVTTIEMTTTEATITEVTITVETTSVVVATEITTTITHINMVKIKELVHNTISDRMNNQTKIRETTEDREIGMTDLDGSTVIIAKGATSQVSAQH